MAEAKEVVIRFKQSDSDDVTKNRVYIHGPNEPFDSSRPYDEIDPPTVDEDGLSRVALVNLPKAEGLDGNYDIDITAVDEVGNESEPLEIDNANFDVTPPAAPTDGGVESRVKSGS